MLTKLCISHINHSLHFFWAMVCTYDFLKMVENMVTSLNYCEGHLEYLNFWYFKTLWGIIEKTAAS